EPLEVNPGAHPTLRILETRVLRGPNVWARSPAIRMLVDLGSLEEWPSNRIPGFNEALTELLPTLEDHACSLGRRGGFLSRLEEGTWLGHVAEHIALELQNLAGTEAHMGKTRSAGAYGQYNMIYEYREEQVGLEAGRLAVALVNHLVAPAEVELDFPAELERLILLAERQAFGPSTQALIDEAVSRDIPWIRLDRHSLVQLGQGVHQQRIRATMTSRTAAIAVDIASDKSLTNQLLSSAGLPVPRSQTVRGEDGAVEAANQIGYPVVVKPLDGNHGRGVSLNLQTAEQVRRAYGLARSESRDGDVVVESYVQGNDYRVLVIDGTVAAVAERVPAGVTADGRHTVRELVEIENSDPRRGIGHERVLTRIHLTDAAEELVRGQGFALDDVPAAGTRVELALTGNMSTGGTAIDRTIEAHPDNIEIAETAARIVGLDVAGIDFIVPDIAVPVREQGGAIVEVNAAPGFRMHTHPTEGEPQYVARPVIDLLFPRGSDARIPIVAVTGTNGKTTTVRMIAHILKLMGRRVGMTTTDGIVIDGRLIRRGDMSGPRSAQMVLQNPSVDTAVFEVARGGILREGLGYDRNDVAVVTNVTGDHLGLHGIDTIEKLAAVKQVLVEAVPRSGTAVLNADDPLVAPMGRYSSGRLVYFSMATRKTDEGYDRVDGHCGRGGAAMVLEQTDDGELVVLRHGSRTMPLVYTHLIPATFGGRARMNVANALAAAAAAWAAGAHLHDIRQGLRTFTTSFFQAPGRLNELEVNGFKVILDYSHNVDGMRRLGEFVELYMRPAPSLGRGRGAGARKAAGDGAGNEAPTGRAIGVIGIPGDRRDEDMREYGRLAAHAFDAIIVREDKNLRGRRPGEAAENVLGGVRQAQSEGARCREVDTVLEELAAVRVGMERAKAGDLVVMCVDDAAAVYRETMAAGRAGRRGVAIAAPGEFAVEEG
ncbi:MAG TPA: cyanophycin synthetase, partial [Candidatus Caenarcaniphilales bacterium]|nr:cyanophycin synthetase [Candidatus Caenarcaniphilales bacterium]